MKGKNISTKIIALFTLSSAIACTTYQHNVLTMDKLPALPAITEEMIEEAASANYSFLAAQLRKLNSGQEVDINMPDPENIAYNETLLHAAAWLGNLAIVEVLLYLGANINAKNKDDETPLYIAADGGHRKIVKALLACSDILVNESDNEGRSPLYTAALGRGEEPKIIQELLTHSDILVNQPDNAGRTPLHAVVSKNYEDVKFVKILLTRLDILVNQPDNEGRIPLHVAAEKGYEEIVKILLTYSNSLVNALDKDLRTPLHVAAEKGHVEIVKILLTYSDSLVNALDKDQRTPLHVAAEKGHVEIVKILLTYSDSFLVNAPDKDLRTPLYVAAESGYEEIVEILLKHTDIIVNPQDSFYQTPLYIAVQEGNGEAVRALLSDSRTNPNQPDSYRNTPLHVGARGYYPEIDPVRLLLARPDVVVNALNCKWQTPLHIAAKEDTNVGVAKALLAHPDILVNALDKDLRTPFHIAVQKSDGEMFDTFLEDLRTNRSQPDKNGRTPLHVAVEFAKLEHVQALLNSGVMINAKDRYKQTPLDKAKQMLRNLPDHQVPTYQKILEAFIDKGAY